MKRIRNQIRIFIGSTLGVLLIFMTSLIDFAEAEEFSANGWIHQWTCIGPFENADGKGLDRDYLEAWGGENSFRPPPDLSSGVVPDSSSLRMVRMSQPGADGRIDFIDLYGSIENQVAYAWCEVNCATGGYAFLKVGSDDGVKIWLNHQLIHHRPQERGAHPDQDILAVELKEGPNSCLVKVDQKLGGWAFYLRFGELFPRLQGYHLRVLEPLEPPLLLLGSQLPIQQTLDLNILNHGSLTLENFHVVCHSPDLQDSRSESLSCKTMEIVKTSLLLDPLPQIKPGTSIEIELEAILPDGSSFPLSKLQTHSESIHPLLRGGQAVSDDPFFIVQLTDPHLIQRESVLAGVKTAERLETAVHEINTMEPLPDFVIVTGDILLDREEGYALYREIMSELKVPYLTVFGNHDKPVGLAGSARIFSQWGYPPYYAFTYKGYSFIGLDSVASSNPPAGEITLSQLKWLDRLLKQLPPSPRLFFLHHDLFLKGVTRNRDQVQGVLKKDLNEQWFFSGHWHADCFVKWGNQRHIVTTATAYLFGNEYPLKHNRKGVPGYRLIQFREGKITTQFKPLGGPPEADPEITDYYSQEEINALLRKE